MRLEMKEHQRMINFMSEIPYLAHWTRNQLSKLVYAFHLKIFKRNQIVFNQGDKAHFVYIVKEGEFEILRARRKMPLDVILNQESVLRSLIGPKKPSDSRNNKLKYLENSYIMAHRS